MGDALVTELGDRAQGLIDSRILQKCDLLIGVFWTRLGSPTGEAESGTVEEIRRHVSLGKPAMVYFSRKPVAPESIDAQQYSAVKAFKEECETQGMIWEFDDIIQFRDLLSRQLQVCIYENPYLQSLVPAGVPDPAFRLPDEPPATPGADLSEPARVLLKTAAGASSGTILLIAVLGGRFIKTGSSTFGSEGGRESARWEGALNELLERDLVAARGNKGQVFELTNRGWELADQLDMA